MEIIEKWLRIDGLEHFITFGKKIKGQPHLKDKKRKCRWGGVDKHLFM